MIVVGFESYMKLDLRRDNWPVDQLKPDATEKIAWQIRGAYIELITTLGQHRRGDVDWWVTSLASRNTYICPLYLRLCKLMLVFDLHEKGRLPDEVVTDSTALAGIIKQHLGGALKVTLVRNKGMFAKSLDYCSRYAAAFYHATFQYLCSLMWLKKRKLPADGAILVDIFISSDNMIENKIDDRYYPGMTEVLEESQRKNFFYTPTHYKVKNYPAHFRKLNRCRDRFLLKEDVLTLADYLYALMHPLRLRRPAGKVGFFGIDIGNLVREALSETISNSGSIEGLLRYRFARRLKKLDFRPGKIIEWFENQEVDHGAIAGWRKFFPELEVVGYQGFLSSPHYFSSIPIEQEQEYQLLPTRIVVIGENSVDSVKEFAPNLEVKTGPAFRFSSLWNEIEITRDREGFNILAALPIHFRESSKIIDMLAGAIKINRGLSSVIIFVKPHPTWKAVDVRRLLSGREFEYELLSSSFDDALAVSDLIVSAASSVCAYAIARAVPCVVVGTPGSLLENSIHKDVDSRLWKICYLAEELADAVEYYTAYGPEQKDELRIAAEAFRAVQFEPVNRESVYDFIGFGG